MKKIKTIFIIAVMACLSSVASNAETTELGALTITQIVLCDVFFANRAKQIYDKDSLRDDWKDAEIPIEQLESCLEVYEEIVELSIGAIYYNANGVIQDYEEAVKSFRKSAKQGDARAQFNLGVSYQYGKGVTKNYVKAYALF